MSAPKKQTLKNPVVRAFVIGISTGFGAGYLPKAPGTWGSLLGIPLGIAILNMSYSKAILLLLGLFIAFSYLAELASRHWQSGDPQKIVSDEIFGQALTFLGFKIFHFHPELMMKTPWGLSPSIGWLLVAFGLFRLFDITKPFPARIFDRHEGGLGIMADDGVAGLYAGLCIWMLCKIWITNPI